MCTYKTATTRKKADLTSEPLQAMLALENDSYGGMFVCYAVICFFIGRGDAMVQKDISLHGYTAPQNS